MSESVLAQGTRQVAEIGAYPAFTPTDGGLGKGLHAPARVSANGPSRMGCSDTTLSLLPS